MPSDLVDITQDDFGAGIYRGREAPGNAVYDAVDALIDDEGQLFRRGGSEYFGTDAPNTFVDLVGLADVAVFAGTRTVGWGRDAASGTTVFYAFRSGTTKLGLGTAAVAATALGVVRPPVVAGGMFILPAGQALALYAGSEKTSDYSANTAVVTNGSNIVAGVGTAWLANVDAGMILTKGGSVGVGIVASVDSDTQLTLKDVWPGVTVGGGYVLQRVYEHPLAAPTGNLAGVATAGTVPRLFAYSGKTLQFSDAGDPLSLGVDAALAHVLTSESTIIGAQGIGDRLFVFGNDGMWALDGLDFDPFDGAGNIQHSIRQLNEIILWGNSGIARWRGAIVVPGSDDVWLVSPDGSPVPVSGGIKPLYREYVDAGYKPGLATVHRSHYVLPIRSGRTLVDVLVCRLDRPYGIGRSGQGWPWTRWSGNATGLAYTQRAESSVAPQLLCSGTDQQVLDVTDCFAPSAANKSDADGTSPDFDVTLRDITTGPGTRRHTVQMTQAVYELVDAASDNPTLVASIAEGLEGAAFSGMGSGPEKDGTTPHTWRFAKMGNRVRVRLLASGPSASLILRKVILRVRQDRRP